MPEGQAGIADGGTDRLLCTAPSYTLQWHRVRPGPRPAVCAGADSSVFHNGTSGQGGLVMAQTRGKRTRTASRRVEGWIKPVEPEFETIQILRDDGSYDEASLPDLTDDQMKELYEWMVFARILDQRALNMQRQGRMGTYPPVGGQEAAQVGSAYALEKEDWLFPSY